jgi:N-acetylmuramoyl-L-alanine amidase
MAATVALLLVSGGQAVRAAGSRPVADDLQLLAQIVCGEARQETYEGKVGVAAVVLNRTHDPRFPDSVAGVVYQTHAFPSVRSGAFYRDTIPECFRAARAALRGLDPTDGALYVFQTDMPRPVGADRPVIRQIGRLRFAR